MKKILCIGLLVMHIFPALGMEKKITHSTYICIDTYSGRNTIIPDEKHGGVIITTSNAPNTYYECLNLNKKEPLSGKKWRELIEAQEKQGIPFVLAVASSQKKVPVKNISSKWVSPSVYQEWRSSTAKKIDSGSLAPLDLVFKPQRTKHKSKNKYRTYTHHTYYEATNLYALCGTILFDAEKNEYCYERNEFRPSLDKQKVTYYIIESLHDKSCTLLDLASSNRSSTSELELFYWLAQTQESSHDRAQAYYHLGKQISKKASPFKSLDQEKYLQQAALQTDDMTVAHKATFKLALHKLATSDFAAAQTLFQRLAHQEDDQTKKIRAIANLGYIMFKQNDFEKASEYWQQSVEQTHDRDIQISALRNLAFLEIHNIDYHKAGQLYEKARSIAQQELESVDTDSAYAKSMSAHLNVVARGLQFIKESLM